MHPIEKEHFSNMQVEMHKAYIRELTVMINIKESKGLALVAGKEYDGLVIESIEGFKSISCGLSKRPLQIRRSNIAELSDGDKVLFTAGVEQYDVAKPKIWIAYNIKKI